MKSFLLLSIVTFTICIHSFAQKINITDGTNIWYYVHYQHLVNPHRPGYKNQLFSVNTNPVIINSKTYSLIDNVLVREDSAANKVYYFRTSDSSDNLLFDYNLQQNDSFILNAYYRNTQRTYVYHILKVDTFLINNVTHKYFWTKSDDTDLNRTGFAYVSFAEGLGCVDYSPVYIINPQNYLDIYSQTLHCNLVCFENKGAYPSITQIPSSSNIPDNVHSCNDTLLNIGSVSKTVYNKINVFPQPALNNVTFKFPMVIANGNISITNIVGKQVFQSHFAQKDNLQLSDLNLSGLYFYRIEDNTNNTVYSGKLIFQ